MSANFQKQVSVFCPAKVNLLLAVGRKREDGYHELVSLAAPVNFGDTLWIAVGKEETDRFVCNDSSINNDPENLVLKAVRAFREKVDLPFPLHIRLSKKIPIGAGLGGGSSDAVGALEALNALSNNALSFKELHEMAAELGSDCPLFLYKRAVIMRGRGEDIHPLDRGKASKLTGKKILLFKPEFSISTRWAYREMDKRTEESAGSLEKTEKNLADWLRDNLPLERLLDNDMASVVSQKFVSIPVLLDALRKSFGLACLMSGSGSCCFAVMGKQAAAEEIKQSIYRAWGNSSFITEAFFI